MDRCNRHEFPNLFLTAIPDHNRSDKTVLSNIYSLPIVCPNAYDSVFRYYICRQMKRNCSRQMVFLVASKTDLSLNHNGQLTSPCRLYC